MIFIDSNIPMYLIGADSRLKTGTQLLLERLAASRQRLVADTEVFQEILHRYSAIGRPEAIDAAFAVLLAMLDEVFPIVQADVLRAREILRYPAGLSARDALHIAVMESHGIHSIATHDQDYDRWPGIQRVRGL